MKWDEFGPWGRRAADWAVDYHKNIRDLPVRAQTQPGDILNALPLSPPEHAEPIEDLFNDFETIIMPGMTHWQHPRFFAYFATNSTPASVLAEYLITNMTAQCMLWQTSPAATELETRVLDWLRQSMDLPEAFHGVIQDSASGATLAAVMTMRERALNWHGNSDGLAGQKPVRVYASNEVHTSIDRAIWITGIGQANLVRIPIQGPNRAMDPVALEAAIVADSAAGMIPAGIIACVGGTGTGATDDIAAISKIAKEHEIYLHVDAAWAGNAMVCPEFREMWAGVEDADSIVFNPYKWIGGSFDGSVHFIRSPEDLTRTLAIQPEYLKTHGKDGIINYSEWSVPLGRRFRALKLWFLIRAYGLEGLRKHIRNNVKWSQDICARIAKTPDFEIVTQPMWSLFTFRYAPAGASDLEDLNQRLVDTINDDGRIYITQTRVDGNLAIRFLVGQSETTEQDVMDAYDVIIEIAKGLTI
ncbi:MAG: aspartate aminotransferase family protein [Rhodobacteraceae bacterium]|nr:aspartate aminotransferase family protein [Paracoccaceae bacterium]